jgi:hypothetical protein
VQRALRLDHAIDARHKHGTCFREWRPGIENMKSPQDQERLNETKNISRQNRGSTKSTQMVKTRHLPDNHDMNRLFIRHSDRMKRLFKPKQFHTRLDKWGILPRENEQKVTESEKYLKAQFVRFFDVFLFWETDNAQIEHLKEERSSLRLRCSSLNEC